MKNKKPQTLGGYEVFYFVVLCPNWIQTAQFFLLCPHFNTQFLCKVFFYP